MFGGVDVPSVMTQKELAELCKISERTLEDWRLRGGGPRYTKVGRLVRYLRADVLAFLERGARTNTGQTSNPIPSPA